MTFLTFCEIVLLIYCATYLYRNISSLFSQELDSEKELIRVMEEMKSTLSRLPFGQEAVLNVGVLISLFLQIAPHLLIMVFCWNCSNEVNLVPQIIAVFILTITSLMVSSEIKTVTIKNKETMKKLHLFSKANTVAQILCYIAASIPLLQFILESFVM